MSIEKASIIPFLNRFFHWFSVGIGTSVMSLMMLSKGSGVDTLGLITALYSIFIVIFEFPSGIISDIVGQKTVYQFSLIIAIVGYTIVFFSNSIVTLFVGFAMYGVSRAFSSGSIEALFINKYIKDHGKESLHKFLSILNAGEILGLSMGALTGGVIPMVWEKYFPGQNRYNGNLTAQILILFLIFICTLLVVKEPADTTKTNKRLSKYVKESLRTVANSRKIILLIFGTMIWGFCFNAIELYWQPKMSWILKGETKTWIFGVINSGYFLASLVGVGIINLILRKKSDKPNVLLFLGRIITGVLIIVLSFQARLFSFASIYLLLFMVNGMLSIPEGTVLNSVIPDEKRSSLLSLSSLMMQFGGIIGSLAYSLLVGIIKISGIWILSGIVFGLSSCIFLRIKKEE
ncbi:MFS transporter [Sediminispirochaeta bajacaliforniensis]|uniref:MFS transporter n=1 Tax=Sediminispirochaeta bajacaliforniensis TaxID=148 RepID=UPI00037AB64F|nr:MFS transporter [Sediminispirochaeta bajacaliforniensis]